MSSLRRIGPALAAFLLLVPHHLNAQRVAVVRPSVIAPGSHELKIPGALAGFTIGDAFTAARSHLGGPVRVDTLGGGDDPPVAFANSAKGITLVMANDGGVGAITVRTREAGVLDGIRVGDPKSAVITRWGPPAAGRGAHGLWLDGAALIAVTFGSDSTVTELTLGRAMTIDSH